MQFLRDPIWQFIGIVVASSIGFAGIWVTIWLRNQKGLAWEVISTTPVVTVRDEAKEAIQVLYQGQPVHNVSQVILRIWNSGNTAILPGDFFAPLALTFLCQLLTFEVLTTRPSDLQVNIGAGSGHTSSRVEIPSLLRQACGIITQ
jgi:hypothetical protein